MTIIKAAKQTLQKQARQSLLASTKRPATRTATRTLQPSTRHLSTTSALSTRPTMALYRFNNPLDALLSTHPLFGPLDSHIDASETGGRHRSLLSSKNNDLFNAPRVDVHELDNGFELTAELPGFKKEDVNLQVDEKTRKITISGESHSEYDSRQEDKQASPDASKNGANDGSNKKAKTKAKAIVTERTYGYCSRSFLLPESADLTQVKAKFDSGVLKVSVPKVVKAKVEPRRVTIEDAGEQ